MNPYDVLGIPSDAPPDAIKRAYRKRAKETHPDKLGGTRERFEEVNRAALVLQDPVRRANYDRTGTIDEVEPDNAVAAAVSIVIGFFMAVVGDAINRGSDPFAIDLVKAARENFAKNIAEFEKVKGKHEQAMKLIERIEKKLRGKKKANTLLRRALLSQAADMRRPIADLEQKIQQYRDAVLLVEGYAFEFEAPAAQPASTRGTWLLRDFPGGY